MTNQEIFDKAVSGIIAQGGPSAIKGMIAMARYRTESGRKCVIGQLIADEFYDSDMEGRTVGSPVVLPAIEKSIGTDAGYTQREFLSHLQLLHDSILDNDSGDAEFMIVFRENAYEFAKQYDLSPHVLEMD